MKCSVVASSCSVVEGTENNGVSANLQSARESSREFSAGLLEVFKPSGQKFGLQRGQHRSNRLLSLKYKMPKKPRHSSHTIRAFWVLKDAFKRQMTGFSSIWIPK